jgi:hypothetical protein
MSIISSGIVITFPRRISAFIQRMAAFENQTQKENVPNEEQGEKLFGSLTTIEKMYLIFSSFQIPLWPLLIFSDIPRFNIYGMIFITIYFLSLRFKKSIIQNPSIIFGEAIAELTIGLDIIRSSFFNL